MSESKKSSAQAEAEPRKPNLKIKKNVDLSGICPYEFRNRNPNNQLIESGHIHKIFNKLGINRKINNIENYRLAFVHKSYLQPTPDLLAIEPPLTEEEYLEDPNYEDYIPLQKEAYERQEFLGDSILGAIIAGYIYERYPDEAEGFLTTLKTKLVRCTSLCILSKKLKFHRYVLLSRKYEEKGRYSDSILEDVLEAFIGGIYRDFGSNGDAYGICHTFVIQLMERYINLSQFVRRQDNYKDLLLQFYHKNFNGANPKYIQLTVHGPTNNRTFRAGVTNAYGDIIATGEGLKLVDAEQMAAKEALKYHNQEVYSDSEEPNQEIYSDSESESL